MNIVNEYNENKRLFPKLFVNPNSASILLPQANKDTTGGKGPGQEGWERLDTVDEGVVQAVSMEVGTRVKCIANKSGMVGRITKPCTDGFYQVQWDDNKSYWRVKSSEIEVIPSSPVSDIAKDIAKTEARRVSKWPDGGMNNSISSSIIYPRENNDTVLPEKKIHSFCLNEDFEQTSIDDQNDWGGLVGDTEHMQEIADALVTIDNNIENENKYGPGHYPSEEEYRSEGLYNNSFVKEKQPFIWLLPNYLAAGAHPILTSNLNDLTLLKKAGFKAIVSVVEQELDDKYLDSFNYLFIPTVPGFSSNLTKICKFIDKQILLEKPVFIHSLQGKGRAATVLAAYLIHKNYVTGAEEAIAYVRQHYQDGAIETTYQEDALMKFALVE